MRVIEKGTDRTAEVHLWAKGDDKALDEYGEGFDKDGALTCYVPVELGQRILVNGRFSGTTRAVQTDIYIDGVCRRSWSTFGKSPKRRSEKIDCISWLVKTAEGVVETECEVTALPEDHTDRESNDVETCPHVGTIEIRLFVLRQGNEEHDLKSPEQTCFYLEEEEDEYIAPEEGIAVIPPQTYMKFEKNSTVIDTRLANRYRKCAQSKRPGKQEWVVFRFHYRTKQSILEETLDVTFVDKDKSFSSKSARELRIESVALEKLPDLSENEHEDDDRNPAIRVSYTRSTVTQGSASPSASIAAARVDDQLSPNFITISGPLAAPTHEYGHPQLLEKPAAVVSSSYSEVTSFPLDSKRLWIPSRSSSPSSKRAKPASPSDSRATATDDLALEATSFHRPKLEMSIERQLADARRHKAKVVEERRRVADEQAAVDKQLEPYQARMKLELERLQKEAQQIEDQKRQEEQHLLDSLALLKELQGAGF